MAETVVVTVDQLHFWAQAMADWDDGGPQALAEIEDLIESAERDNTMEPDGD